MLKKFVFAAAVTAGSLGAAQAAPASAAASAAASAPVSAAKKELVAHLLKLQQPGIEGLARQLAEQPAVQMMQQLGPVLQRLPEERREAVARDIQADIRNYVDEAVPIVRGHALKLAPTIVGPLLEERFSEAELKQIVGTLESPAFRKYQSVTAEIPRSLGERLVAESRDEVGAKLQTLQQSVSRRLAPPAAPASSGSAARK